MTGCASVVKNAQDREHRRKFVFGFDSLRSRDKKKTEEGAPLLGMRGRGGPYIYKVRTATPRGLPCRILSLLVKR